MTTAAEAELNRRTLVLSFRQTAARQALMAAMAAGEGTAEGEIRQQIHALVDLELDVVADRVKLIMEGGL